MAIQNVIRAIDARNYRITQHADEEPIHSVSAYVETNQQAILITVYRHRPGTLDQLAEKEDVMVTLLDKCPVCGGEIVEKEVDKVLRGGNLTETLNIQAAVCLRCGERLYTPEDVDRFEQIRSTLKAKGKANTQRRPS